ncbi:hypothetical protein [Rhodopseudomonas sp. P2A-2r]|uniref:hypothetical protein n=1 Tax=unclassified Rhodopseudomonas TaxID=2638247 RepID=UPI002234385D|nr:hypothetical protein [Rhodopseudomonas sp. P2A-2r]UZE51362.1 hypothetical protein ONR75_12570 [Rhodopseudomonas sp. P2A-2r]
MKVLRAAALLALLAVPAYAQSPTVNLMPEVKTRSPEEKEQDAIADKAYRESLRKIPDAKAAADPWGTVRNDAPKATVAKPRTRTGNNAN